MSSVMTIIPINSEKAYQLSTEGIYLFKVPLSANKQQIAQLVENEYNVTVTGVKTLIQSGKSIAFSRGKRSRPGTTKRTDTKKAYVSLKDGDTITVFEEQKEEGAS